MSTTVNWGVLSTANIALDKVIPGLQASRHGRVHGVASRRSDLADDVARKHAIPRAYGSYDDLLQDPDIEAVYIPLPNHLHLEWTLKAVENGKHVLCEKPLVLNTEDVRKLIIARDQYGVKVGEGFMVDSHPQWLECIRRIRQGELGQLKSIQGFFSYYNDDPDNIRNNADYGGGALWDIGVYPVHTSRLAFEEEVLRVCALISYDERFKTDVLSSVIMQFPSGHATFQCSTLLATHQSMHFFGDKKRLEIEIPFNAPSSIPCCLFISDNNLHLEPDQIIEIDVCDQYALQGDAFSRSILNDTEVPVPLENSLWNTATVEAIFRSAENGRWEDVAL